MRKYQSVYYTKNMSSDQKYKKGKIHIVEGTNNTVCGKVLSNRWIISKDVSLETITCVECYWRAKNKDRGNFITESEE